MGEAASVKSECGLLASSGAPVGVRAFGLQTLGTLFKAALFHELYARERFQIFFPAMSGQEMKFAAEKRAEMRRAAF